MPEITCSAKWLRRMLCAGAIGLALAAPQPVYAQDDPELEIEDPDAADDGTAEQEGEVIIVTGSAIERRDLITPAPVTVLDKSVLDAAGKASVGDILQNLPAQSNAINVQFNNGGSGATRINLRGLDAERTLVLINGRRVVPGGTGANASVDLNSIPSAMVERVEVLKDGASAVYGSDAIGGVVNIITRKDFEGTEANVYFGATGDAIDAGTFYDVSVTSGVTSKRGNILVSGGFYQQTSLMADARSYSTSDKSYDWATGQIRTDGSFTTPQGAIFLSPSEIGDDAEPGNEAWQEILSSVDRESDGSLYLYNDPNEGWRRFNQGGNSDVAEGDFYNYQPENYLVTPLQRYSVSSVGHYNFTDNVRGYFEASYANRKSDQLLAPEPLATSGEGIVVAADNYYNPFGRSFSSINRRMIEGGNRRFFQDVDTFRVVAGLDGNLPERLPVLSNWRWDVSANFGRTQATELNSGRYVLNRVEKALGPSFMDADGILRCGTPDNFDSSCVPLNLFGGEGSITPDMMSYITYTGISKGYNDQRSVVASLTGRLIEFPWGGSAGLSLGVERRQLAGGDQPDPLTASGDTTGNKSEPTEGSYDVNEVFAELSSYVIEDMPFAKAVEVTGALRAFDYSTFGAGFTWKAGGRWQIFKDVAFRGTVSTAFRAPQVGELFSGQIDSFPRVSDPCDTSKGELTETERQNCSMDGVIDGPEGTFVDGRTQLPTTIGGNTELESEEAFVYTGGIVVEPRYVPGLSVTVDYFNIAIDNAIDPIGTSVILSNCYGKESRVDCDKITRDPVTNKITDIDNRQTNVGGNDTAGVDIGVRYDLDSPVGRFRFNAEGTWLHKFDQIQADGNVVEGKGVYDLGVFPDFKGNFTTIWGMGNLGAGFNTSFISGFTECEDDDCNDPDKVRREVNPYLKADVFATYGFETLAGNSEVRIGVNNVFNADPVILYNGGTATSDAATYDFLGQFYYIRFVQTM